MRAILFSIRCVVWLAFCLVVAGCCECKKNGGCQPKCGKACECAKDGK